MRFLKFEWMYTNIKLTLSFVLFDARLVSMANVLCVSIFEMLCFSSWNIFTFRRIKKIILLLHSSIWSLYFFNIKVKMNKNYFLGTYKNNNIYITDLHVFSHIHEFSSLKFWFKKVLSSQVNDYLIGLGIKINQASFT